MSPTDVTLAGRYRLEGRIASGGVGEVWRGRDEVLGRPVAVKLLRAEFARDPETVARLRSEARLAALLSHPGIAQVYDFGQAPPFLVMELVDGPSLAQVLGGGALEPDRVMDVVAQAAEGLDAAHRAGLVHRDIKPGNLLLGPGGRVKITDFGISRAAGSASVTGTGQLLGTPAYLAPERVAGQEATPASDLYSLGVLAWECLAGTPPFTGSPVEVAFAHRDRRLPPLPYAVPAEVAALVEELTAKHPAARPPTAGEVARRAARLRDGLRIRSTLPLDVPAYRPPVAARAGRTGRNGRGGRVRGARLSGPATALILGGVIAAVVLGVLLAGALGGGGSRPPAVSHPAAPSGTSAAATVQVNAESLVGQPLSDVQRQLQQLGLTVRVVRQPSDHDLGTVLSVQPSGRVPAGSVITVTAAAPHDAKHDHGDGNGNGNGNGNGDGGG